MLPTSIDRVQLGAFYRSLSAWLSDPFGSDGKLIGFEDADSDDEDVDVTQLGAFYRSLSAWLSDPIGSDSKLIGFEDIDSDDKDVDVKPTEETRSIISVCPKMMMANHRKPPLF